MSDIKTLDDSTAKTVETSANALSRANTRKELATRAHYAFVGYFGGSDPTGAIRSQTKSFLGASLALLRGESATEANAYATEEKSELRAELDSAFRALFPEDSDVPDIDGRTSVGPLLPYIVAIARHTRDIDETEADGFEDTSLAGE